MRASPWAVRPLRRPRTLGRGGKIGLLHRIPLQIIRSVRCITSMTFLMTLAKTARSLRERAQSEIAVKLGTTRGTRVTSLRVVKSRVVRECRASPSPLRFPKTWHSCCLTLFCAARYSRISRCLLLSLRKHARNPLIILIILELLLYLKSLTALPCIP